MPGTLGAWAGQLTGSRVTMHGWTAVSSFLDVVPHQKAVTVWLIDGESHLVGFVRSNSHGPDGLYAIAGGLRLASVPVTAAGPSAKIQWMQPLLSSHAD